jgi:hypothetical protein
VKPGDLVLLKEEWQTLGIYYGPGVITMIDEGKGGDDLLRDQPWKSFRVQWSDDWSWHDPDELEVISET